MLEIPVNIKKNIKKGLDNKPNESKETPINNNPLPENFNDMSQEEKIIFLKTKIARAEANLSTLSKPSAINKCIDNIFDLKRQLNMISSDKNKEFISDNDDRLDVFELITLNAKQVATRRSNSLVVTGHPGVGKTMTVIQAISFLNPHTILDTVIKVTDYGKEEEGDNDENPKEETSEKDIKVELPKVGLLSNISKAPIKRVIKPKSNSRNNTESGYFIAQGGCTTAYLYELLFVHRDKILVFDDFDSILKDAESVNLLKAALDTYPIREISRMTKGNTFNSFGMSDAEMEEKYELEGKLPNQFRFTGGIIFVSNIHEDKFDKALISRSLHVEVRLTRQQVIDRMLQIIPDIRAEVPMEYKIEALNYLDYITSSYRCKFPLDIRQLIHTIDNRTEYPPEDPKYVREGKLGKLYVWQQMAKERLIERVFKYD